MGWFTTLLGIAAVVVTGGAATPWVAAALGGGAIAGAVATFAVQALTTYAVSSLITKQLAEDAQNGASQSNAQLGNRVAAPVSTTNKIPIVYGNAYMPPIVIDAKISKDQQFMWYVLAYSEVTDTGTINFNDPAKPAFPLAYWGDKKIVFDTIDKTKVTGLIDETTGTPVTDTKVNGKIHIYFYGNGSDFGLYGAPPAYTVLSDSTTGKGINVTERWNSTYKMEKTAFAVVRVKYDQNAGTTGLDTVTAYVRNSLTVPGDVIYDYMTNTRYGCSIDPNRVDVAALQTNSNCLNNYSNTLIPYNDNGIVQVQPRYRINGPVITTNSCLSNLTELTDSCDSWLQWDETQAKWSVVINCSIEQADLTVSDLYTLYSDQIKISDVNNPSPYYGFVIGGVNITPLDLSSNYNGVTVQFPSKLIRDQVDYAYINLPTNLYNPNEPTNNLTVTLPYVNDSVQAQYIATRRLSMARDDLVVTVTTDYSGIQIDAGDVIRVYHNFYGWDEANGFPDGKLFRVIQVQETLSEDMSLLAKLTLNEYNDSIYGSQNISAFQPSPNTGITDPTVISQPSIPTVTNILTTQAIPSFDITVTTPATGSAIALEYWYALSESNVTPTIDKFYLLETQYPSGSAVYENNVVVTRTISSIPASPIGLSYYFMVRAAGTTTKSDYSNISSQFQWLPNPTATIIGSNFSTSFQPSPVSIGTYANGEPNYTNVVISLFGLVGPAIADFTPVTSNALMGNSTWRVGTPVTDGINIGSVSESIDQRYAVWNNISGLTANVATVSVPIFYKDSTGTMYQSPTAILNVNKTAPGQTGSRGIVTLAYVPVLYNPTTANVNQLNTSFLAMTGFTPPIENDGAIFYVQSNGLSSTRRYSNTASNWVTAVIEIPGNVIVANTITGTQIVDNAITGIKITDGAVDNNKIADGAVNQIKITDGAINNTKIATNAVNTIHISTDAVTSDKVKANNITTVHIINDAIISNKIANNAIISDKISSNAVLQGAIANSAIISRHVSNSAITNDSIANDAISADKIQAGSITTNKLAANFIYSGNIVSLNGNFGNTSAPGYWFSSNGSGYFGENLTVGGIISASKLRANVVSAENIVVGSVTQSRSTTSNPTTVPVAYVNSTSSFTYPWPNNTRATIPADGVTIIPTTDPTSSANTAYVEGSRIEIGFSARVWANSTSVTNADQYNLLEVWKSGASSYYGTGINTIKHAYNQTSKSTYFNVPSNQTIHAFGYGGIDTFSSDGGVSWSSYPNQGIPSTKILLGSIPSWQDDNFNIANSMLETSVVGPYQVSDQSSTQFVNRGFRDVRSSQTVKPPISFAGTVGADIANKIINGLNDICVAPDSGGNGAGYPSTSSPGFAANRSGSMICGNNGIILFKPASSTNTEALGGGSISWITESTGTIQTLNAVYAGKPDASKNYTAICVGSTGTVLKSTRIWSANSYTWLSKTVNLQTGSRIITDLYDVASDDSLNSTTSKWVAVGQYGVLLYSGDNGDSWTQILTPTADNLNGVKYCNGTWVAVGNNGLVLYSTTGTSWTKATIRYTKGPNNGTVLTKNLNCIDYSYIWNKFNIGGEGGLIVNGSFSGTTMLTTTATVDTPSESYNLTRLTFYGSNPVVSDLTVAGPQNQVLNGQIITGTIVDVNYVRNQSITYYLVVGNMRGPNGVTVYAGQCFLNVTEVKR